MKSRVSLGRRRYLYLVVYYASPTGELVDQTEHDLLECVKRLRLKVEGTSEIGDASGLDKQESSHPQVARITQGGSDFRGHVILGRVAVSRKLCQLWA